MTDRDRLIEILKVPIYPKIGADPAEVVADYLLANGVIVPPCKIGDKTFLLLEKTNGGFDIVESRCVRITDNGYGKYYSMAFDCVEIGNTLEFGICDFGRYVFLTKEEAEKALKEREK